MSWKEWFGFTKPRDAPDTELPQIEDNVRDSGGVFVFGITNSRELVNGKSDLQISTVYACVRLLAVEKYGSVFFKGSPNNKKDGVPMYYIYEMKMPEDDPSASKEPHSRGYDVAE